MATTKLLAGLTAAALAIAGCGSEPAPPPMPDRNLDPKDALLDLEDLPETWSLPSSDPNDDDRPAVPSCLSLVTISSTNKSAEVTYISKASEEWMFNQVAIYTPAAANQLMDGLDARQIVCGSAAPDRPVPPVSRLSFEQVGDETVAFRISDPTSFGRYNLVIYRHGSVMTLISHGGRTAPDVRSTRALAEASLLEVEGAERKVRKSR